MLATSFSTPAAQGRVSAYQVTISGSRELIVARSFYSLHLEPKAMGTAGGADFKVVVALVRESTGESRGKEGQFPAEFRRAGCGNGERSPTFADLKILTIKGVRTREQAEADVEELSSWLRDEGHRDGVIEEMGFAEKIQRTAPDLNRQYF